MKGYKAFEKGLVCKGKQYAENTIFEEENAKVCECGMHFCENPLDVLDYYPLIDNNGELTEFAEVEALDEVLTDDNKKYCTKKLKIGAKLDLPAFVKASIDFQFEKTPVEKTIKKSKSASGDSSKLAASGDYSKLAASGYSSKLAASGYSSQLAASGNYSVVVGIGVNTIAKAVKGCWITLAEWKYDDEKEATIPVCVKTEYVDGKRIKENVFYKLVDGEFTEV